jgi:hypothetical protein
MQGIGRQNCAASSPGGGCSGFKYRVSLKDDRGETCVANRGCEVLPELLQKRMRRRGELFGRATSFSALEVPTRPNRSGRPRYRPQARFSPRSFRRSRDGRPRQPRRQGSPSIAALDSEQTQSHCKFVDAVGRALLLCADRPTRISDHLRFPHAGSRPPRHRRAGLVPELCQNLLAPGVLQFYNAAASFLWRSPPEPASDPARSSRRTAPEAIDAATTAGAARGQPHNPEHSVTSSLHRGGSGNVHS